jgi:hypothetical protein
MQRAVNVSATADVAKEKHLPIYAVSRVGLDADGRVTSVEWGPVDPSTHRFAEAPGVARVAEVVAVIRSGHRVVALFPSGDDWVPGGDFDVVKNDIGWQTIALTGAPSLDREVHDMARLPG